MLTATCPCKSPDAVGRKPRSPPRVRGFLFLSRARRCEVPRAASQWIPVRVEKRSAQTKSLGGPRFLCQQNRKAFVRKFLQRRTEAQAAAARQRRAEHLGATIGKCARESAGDFMATEQRTDERIGIGCVLIGAELPLPGAVADRISPDGPEIRAAPNQDAVSENEHAVITALHAVEHVDVDGIEPILHRKTAALPAGTVQPMGTSVENRKRPKMKHPALSDGVHLHRGRYAYS